MFQIHELLQKLSHDTHKNDNKSTPKTYQESRVVDVIIVSPT